jgi:hypothetical protein
MNDFENDEEERIAPLQPRRKIQSPAIDRVLALVGLGLAGASAFFPWYVFFNEDKFAINVAEGDRTRDLPDWPARNVFSVSPLAMTNKNDIENQAQPIVDPLTTATISNADTNRNGDGIYPEDQPFPSTSAFRLLHVANGRALIQDPSGMYVVRVGSTLPDETKLAKIEQQDGKWVIVTSNGSIHSEK